jgi:hypothetical protein
MDFKSVSIARGIVSAVNVSQTILPAHQSTYIDLNVNEVKQKERTFAKEGSYASSDYISLHSQTQSRNNTYLEASPDGPWNLYPLDTLGPVFVYYFQPETGTLILRSNDSWNVTLHSIKTLEYHGTSINKHDFVENNFDYAKSSYLYNKDLSLNRDTSLSLDRTNFTVIINNWKIKKADLQMTRSLDYHIASYSTGIADFGYSQMADPYNWEKSRYSSSAEGDGRYIGDYEANRRVSMSSVYNDTTFDWLYDGDNLNLSYLDWMPCCVGGYLDMPTYYQKGTKGFGSNVKGIFDCTCWKQQSN